MLKNKIYRKYYPIKKYTDLYLFEKGEQNQLINWIKIYEREIKYRNFENIIKAIKTNSIVVPIHILHYKKPVSELVALIGQKKFSQIDKEDIVFLNEVLKRHKYNSFLSVFLTPKYEYILLENAIQMQYRRNKKVKV